MGFYIFQRNIVWYQICQLPQWNQCIEDPVYSQYNKSSVIPDCSYKPDKVLKHGSICTFCRFRGGQFQCNNTCAITVLFYYQQAKERNMGSLIYLPEPDFKYTNGR